MIRKLIFSLTFFLVAFLLSAQSFSGDCFLQATQLFQEEKYGFSQQLYQKIYNDNLDTNEQKEEIADQQAQKNENGNSAISNLGS